MTLLLAVLMAVSLAWILYAGVDGDGDDGNKQGAELLRLKSELETAQADLAKAQTNAKQAAYHKKALMALREKMPDAFKAAEDAAFGRQANWGTAPTPDTPPAPEPKPWEADDSLTTEEKRLLAMEADTEEKIRAVEANSVARHDKLMEAISALHGQQLETATLQASPDYKEHGEALDKVYERNPQMRDTVQGRQDALILATQEKRLEAAKDEGKAAALKMSDELESLAGPDPQARGEAPVIGEDFYKDLPETGTVAAGLDKLFGSAE